ncbi:MAG: ribosome silencing factor [Ruminococcus sp.]|nr:ribosome silencing factor [Ruminococcus sp.]
MTQEQKIKVIAKALDSKRAEDIQIIGIKDLTIVADYFFIANGTSTTHTKALVDEVEFKLKENSVTPLRIEGYSGATWIVLDYGDIVVHVFYKETRDFYNLEKLWSDGEAVDVQKYLED